VAPGQTSLAQEETVARKTGKGRTIRCDPIEHQNHLCYLIAHRRVSKAARLVGDGRYFCEPCGRSASAPEYLCDPVERSAVVRPKG
jgi:hypothetical protein